MIQETQRGLISIFTLTILGFTLAVLIAVGVYGSISLDRATRRHLLHEVFSEIVPFYERNDLTSLNSLPESDYFQVLNRAGKVVVATINAHGFNLPVDKALIDAAFSGGTEFQEASVNGGPFLVVYFPLDEFYVGRAATSTALMKQQREVAIWMVVFGLPLLVVLSFLVSRYLVRRAMRPVSELFTFHTTFSSNVSHELRTPLTALRGNMEVALRREQPPEEYLAVLETGLEETERMISTLDNLSLLAASQEKGMALMRAEADLGDLLTALVEGERERHTDIELSLRISGPVPCRCDSSLMRHAVRNLVENSVRYTPPGGVIVAEARREEQGAVLVMSNPCDQPLSDPESLLRPFEQGKNKAHRGPKGRGLGLYLAHTIVRAHGGELSVSVEGGVRFVVRVVLP